MRSSTSSRPSAAGAAWHVADAILRRCDIRCGNCRRSSRTSRNTVDIDSPAEAVGHRPARKLPAGIPPGTAGPRLVALVALLMGCYRQSKRRTALFLEQILGQPCSPGWVVKLQRQATAAVREAYEELATALPREPTLGIDESPTKEGLDKAWLWTYVARRFTLFAIRDSRAATGVSKWLDSQFAGVVCCDRARMYLRLPQLQWCWAHLKRDFQALVDSGDK